MTHTPLKRGTAIPAVKSSVKSCEIRYPEFQLNLSTSLKNNIGNDILNGHQIIPNRLKGIHVGIYNLATEKEDG